MSKRVVRAFAAAAMLASAMAMAQSPAQPETSSAGPVTVVIEVTLASDTEPSEALVALNDVRAMMRRQPGYLSEEFMQNLNTANSPRFVHVSRWALMEYWAAVFRSPEFGKLSAHGNEHYRVSASAFVPAE
jgi:heme-degrading monooxygenase HmoA